MTVRLRGVGAQLNLNPVVASLRKSIVLPTTRHTNSLSGGKWQKALTSGIAWLQRFANDLGELVRV